MAAVAPQEQLLDQQFEAKAGVIKSRVHARIGLLGNPSDGYHGKTISFALANFWAEVCVFWQMSMHPDNTCSLTALWFPTLSHFLMVSMMGLLGSLQVTLTPAPTVSFQPHPEHDAQEFASITHLANRIDSHGYYGGVRLLMVSILLPLCWLQLVGASARYRYAAVFMVHAPLYWCTQQGCWSFKCVCRLVLVLSC